MLHKEEVVRITKEAGIPAILASVVTLIPVLGVFWLVLEPFLKNSISVALANDIQNTVQREIAPIRGGFDILLSEKILALQKDIALLERKGITNLSADETILLIDLRNQLDYNQRALAALRK